MFLSTSEFNMDKSDEGMGEKASSRREPKMVGCLRVWVRPKGEDHSPHRYHVGQALPLWYPNRVGRRVWIDYHGRMEPLSSCLLFFLYGFLGWVLKVVVTLVFEHRWVNRGFLMGPLSPLFGVGALAVVAILTPFHANLLVLSVLSVMLTSALQYTTHWALEAVFGLRFWDHSHARFTVNGRIRLESSLISGALGVATVLTIDPFFRGMIGLVPPGVLLVLLVILGSGLAVDLAFSVRSLLVLRRHLSRPPVISEGLAALPDTAIRVAARLLKAFPEAGSRKNTELFEKLRTQVGVVRRPSAPVGEVFAPGLSFAKLFWVFLVAAWVGVVVEVVYGLVVQGHLENRSGLVWGVTNPVYGLGAVVMTLLLSQNQRHRDLTIFCASMVIGGAFEYLCSWGQEWAFGSVSWEYSGTVLNLGGRTSLSFALAWGFLGLVWVRYLYPTLSRWIEHIPRKVGKPLTLLLVVLLTLDVAVSAAAVWRWSHRVKGDASATVWGQVLDRNFDNRFLAEVYPNMRFLPR